MWLTDLAKLEDPKYGLTVRFENGWKRRGASGGAQMKGVYGVLWHHDVAPRSGTYPLRSMLRDGRAGLSGPLCHIGFDRDGVVHVVGAGKANHAGTGSVPGVVRNGGNTRLIGIEMTSAGTRPWDWTDAQLRQMPKLGAALSDIFGLSRSKHWAHYEYSNGGKIDPAGLPGAMPGLRSRIAAVRFGGVSVSTGGAGVPTPARPASKPTQKPAAVKAPAFPLPRKSGALYYYGPSSGPKTSVSGMGRNSAVPGDVAQVNGRWRSKGLALFQARLIKRGWSDLARNGGADGRFGDTTEKVVRQFQKVMGLKVDGVVGPATWAAAWAEPVK